MLEPSYRDFLPQVGEGVRDYIYRLEQNGFEEMYIRKALAYHFSLGVNEFGALFNEFETARLRHLTMLKHLAPNRTGYSMTKKVAKNLGISEELATQWVERFQEVGDVPYRGWEALQDFD